MNAYDVVLAPAAMTLHVREWGAGDGLPVLLLHGSRGFGAQWQDVAEVLAAPGLRLLAPDLRGHGESRRPAPSSYRLEDYAADLVALAGALGLGPVVLAGHSMAALVTMLLAGTGMLPVRAVALMDIEARPPASQAQRLNEAGARPLRRFASMEEVIAAEQRALPDVLPARVARLALAAVRPVADGGYEYRADQEALRQFPQVDLRPLLPRISCPALVVRGADSHVLRPEVAAQMAAALPLGRLVTIPDAVHQLHIQQPEAVAAALAGLLRSVLDEGG